MKTFKIIIRSSDFFVKEIEAKDYSDAKQKAKDFIWHDRYPEWGISRSDIDVYDVIEKDIN